MGGVGASTGSAGVHAAAEAKLSVCVRSYYCLPGGLWSAGSGRFVRMCKAIHVGD
jgi:hypothetical protein